LKNSTINIVLYRVMRVCDLYLTLGYQRVDMKLRIGYAADPDLSGTCNEAT
jgi:hypothetical protein